MGWPEFGSEREEAEATSPFSRARRPVLDADRADDLKERLKEEGKWPPRAPAPKPEGT